MQDHHVDVGGRPLVPSDINGHTVAVRAPDIGYVELDGQGICYDADADEMHLLSPVAGLIWNCLDGRSTASEISADLADAFSQGPSIVRNSVFLALVDFAEKALITGPVEDASADDTTHQPVAEPRLLTDPPST